MRVPSDRPWLEPGVRPADPGLPLVARIVIEVRSDGTTTTSRGILESPGDRQRSEIVLQGAARSASLIALLQNLITASATARRVLRAVLRPGESGIDHDAQAPGDPRSGA